MADKASVVIPVFNASGYINKTIESILNQSHQEFEIICIDDGSTDKSAEIISRFEDPRIFYFHYTNAGVSSARNKGLDKVSGDYVVFLDSDDCLSQSFLEKRIEVLKSSEVIGVCSEIELIDEDGNKIFDGENYKAITTIDQILNADPNMISCPSAYLFKSIELKKSNTRFNEKLNSSADKYFILELLINNKIKFIPSSPIYYRVVSNSMSHQLTYDSIKDKLCFITELKERFGKSIDIKNSTYSRLNYSIAGMAFYLKKRKLLMKHLFKSFILSPFTFFSLLFK